MSPLKGKEDVEEYSAQTFPTLLPRLKRLPKSATESLPLLATNYRWQNGVLVLKDKSVLYWRAIFDGKAYQNNKRVGYITFMPHNINEMSYYSLPE